MREISSSSKTHQPQQGLANRNYWITQLPSEYQVHLFQNLSFSLKIPQVKVKLPTKHQ